MSRSQAIPPPRQDLIHSPITALAFYTSPDNQQRYILAGEDVWLKVYSALSQQEPDFDGLPVAQLRIFDEQPIHGISVSGAGGLLIWGASSVAVVPRRSVELLLVRGSEPPPRPVECRACDWVYDARISEHEPSRGVVVTAHNEVVPFTVSYADPHDGAQAQQLTLVWGELLFLSRPILYSASVRWTADDEVLVAAGTVFGEIVVWKCRLVRTGKAQHCMEELFVLTGHEGSIFGVAISPDVELVPGSGERRRLLASCSDDRTIRVWDITESLRENEDVEHGQKVEALRETGFGGVDNSEVQRETSEGDAGANRCLAVAIGHASRIWHVRFTYDSSRSEGPIEVFSFGEDTTVQKWRLVVAGATTSAPAKTAAVPSRTYPYSLEHVDRAACHNGKHIWSCAIGTDGSGRTWIVTGGADGKITLLKDQASSRTGKGTASRNQNVVLSLEDVMSPAATATGVPPHSKRDGFLRYAFLSEDKLLVSTISGRLLLGDLAAGPAWSEVMLQNSIQNDLKGYNVVKTVAPGVAIVGSTSGRLYTYREDQGLVELTEPLGGKISDVFCIPSCRETGVRVKLQILVTVLGRNEATILTLDGRGPQIHPEGSSTVPLHPGFVVTAVGVCEDLLLLGSRKGFVNLFEKEAGEYVERTHRNDCTTKGGDAVTSILTLPPLKGAQAKYVLTTCRDGKYRIYEIASTSTANFELHLRHETTPPLGPMLEGATLVRPQPDSDPELIIHGFRSTNFVVWNETRQHEIASVPCGGAHRTFDYFSDPTSPNKLRLVYTKASAMGVFSQDEPAVRVVRPGGHGREIRAVARGGGESGSDLDGYVATGAEDTCIRIWKCSRDTHGAVAEMRCLAVLQKHTAGLQALKWEKGGYLLSSAGAEEFFVWRVTTLESEYRGLAVVCEAVYPFRSPDADLRIMDFDSLSQGGEETPSILLTMAFSNSVLKTYRYTQSEGFVLQQTDRYTGACLTQVKHMAPLPGDNEGMLRVVTGSTDGVVAVWTATSPLPAAADENGYQMLWSRRAHDNAVKSLEIMGPSEQGAYNVFTGGDDNALSHLVFNITAKKSEGAASGTMECTSSLGVTTRDAHAAAITDVKILRFDQDYVYLATASNDQRLKLWRIVRGRLASGAQIALLYNAYSGLADPGGLEVIEQGNLMVGGVGLEVWDFGHSVKLQLP